MTTRSVADELLEILEKGKKAPTPIEVPEEVPMELPEPLKATPWAPYGVGKMRLVPFSMKFWKNSHSPDHLVAEFDGFDSAEPNPLYVPPKEEFEWCSFAFSNKIKPLAVGPTGCGKTLLFEYYAAICGRPCLRVDNTQELDKAQVFGTVHITDGDTDFVPGDIPLSANAPTLVILDELSRATGGANMIYKRMLDRNEIYLPEMKEAGAKAIIPDEYWVVCATDNTKGDGEDMDKYPMSNVQDAAFRNAWGMLLEFDYLSEKQEGELISAWSPKMAKDSVKKLASFSNLVHAGFKKGEINTAFSPRQLKDICKMFNGGVALHQAIGLVYINFCSKSEKSDAMECLRAAFGSK
jgi:MoxR-like ATPase